MKTKWYESEIKKNVEERKRNGKKERKIEERDLSWKKYGRKKKENK